MTDKQERDTEREAFEAWAKSKWPYVNLSRGPDGYVATVPHQSIPIEYASLQMLWESWQAARSQQQQQVAALLRECRYYMAELAEIDAALSGG